MSQPLWHCCLYINGIKCPKNNRTVARRRIVQVIWTQSLEMGDKCPRNCDYLITVKFVRKLFNKWAAMLKTLSSRWRETYLTSRHHDYSHQQICVPVICITQSLCRVFWAGRGDELISFQSGSGSGSVYTSGRNSENKIRSFPWILFFLTKY